MKGQGITGFRIKPALFAPLLVWIASTTAWANRCTTEFVRLLAPESSFRVFIQDDFVPMGFSSFFHRVNKFSHDR